MSKISIAEAKAIRESIGATHIVVFSVDSDGTQHVATHGASKLNASQAAKAGNRLKKALGWENDLCNSTPLPRICKNCVFWKADYGMHCFNGWSKDGSDGFCRFEPNHIRVSDNNLCGHFEPNC